VAQTTEEFDDFDVPSGDVAGDLVRGRDGAFAATVANRLGDIQSLPALIEVGHWNDVQQSANVRDQPVVAGFDRLIVPHAVDVAAEDRRLSADAIDHLAQRSVARECVGILRTVHPRQQIPKLVSAVDIVMIRHRHDDACLPLSRR
jgi:hypothetical protein